MEHISENRFSRSGIYNANEKLFVSLWAELFNPNTIDTYRVRVMNAHNILQEMINVVDLRLEDEIDMRNLHFVSEKAIRILSQDIICKEVYLNEFLFAKAWLSKARHELKQSTEFRAFVSRIRILKNQLDKNYFLCLLSAIERSIFENEPQERLIMLTKALATELVSLGFSMEYLYSRKMVLLDTSGTFTFRQRWDHFKRNIEVARRNFYVFIKFSGPAEWTQVGSFLRGSIEADLDLQLDNDDVSSFRILPGTLIAKIGDVQAADAHSAAIEASFEFSTFLDLAKFEYRLRDNVIITTKVLVVDTEQSNCFLTDLSPRLSGFQSPGNIDRFLALIKSWKTVNDPVTNFLDQSSRERIQNSMRYFRMGLETRVLESRFLHFWIALEFLLKTGSHGSIIGPIIEFVPKSLALQFFKKLLRDLSANLTRLRINKDVLQAAGIHEDAMGRHSVEDIFKTLRDQERFNKLIAAVSNPLAIYRLSEMRDFLNDSKKAKERLVHHSEDLRWHLQRMYRIRNRIAHSAAVDFDLLQVESNLSYYYTMLLNNILFLASKSTTTTSIEELFYRQQATFDFVLENLKVGTPRKEILLPQLLYDQTL